MAKKSKIRVESVLDLMEEEQEVICVLYAYGMYYGDTASDNMKTVKDCKENMNVSCLRATVTAIRFEDNRAQISAELVM